MASWGTRVDWSVEFERRQKVDGITDKPAMVHLRADPKECEAVARRLELQAVERLEADCTLDRLPQTDHIRVRGRLKAQVIQTCVVTLEPLPAEIRAEFERVYVPGWTPEMEGGEETVDPEAPDLEPLEGDSIDL